VLLDTLIARWLTVGCVTYSVVRLVTHDCTGGLSTRYPTVDSVVDGADECQHGLNIDCHTHTYYTDVFKQREACSSHGSELLWCVHITGIYCFHCD